MDYADVCAPGNGEILMYLGHRQGDHLTRISSLEALLEKLRQGRPRHITASTGTTIGRHRKAQRHLRNRFETIGLPAPSRRSFRSQAVRLEL